MFNDCKLYFIQNKLRQHIEHNIFTSVNRILGNKNYFKIVTKLNVAFPKTFCEFVSIVYSLKYVWFGVVFIIW